MPKAVFVALLLLSSRLLGETQPAPAPEVDRLIATGKLWATIKYFHPYLAYRAIDWDKALVAALPKIRAAQNSAQYEAALRSMLDQLHDPATYAATEVAQTPETSLAVEKQPDGTLIISQAPSPQPSADAIQQLTRALLSPSRIVFDLRVPPGAPNDLSNRLDSDTVAKLLTRTAVNVPAQRTWIHSGLPPAVGSQGSGGYTTSFNTTAGYVFAGDPSAPEHRVAFLLNENSLLPHIGCALWAEGKAHVLAESDHYQLADAISVTIPMGLGVNAVVRLSEPLASRPVISVKHASAVPDAIARLANPPDQTESVPQPVAPAPLPDLSYSDMRYPPTEYRILAAYKTWAVFRNFFAYRDLMDEDWDDVFTTFLPKFIAAKDAREYNLTLSEMVTHVADSHASIESAELTDYFGAAPVGLRLRLIEKKPAITEVLDPEAVKAGIRVGDIVTKVDGEDIKARFHREERYLPASTPQSLGYCLMQRILDGPDGSEAALTIETAEGETREVHLKRSSNFTAPLNQQRSGEVIKLLPGNIGYADLDRLLPDQVDGMFDQFRSANAIIFDMRGSPHGTASSIAPRLTERPDVPAAIINGPLSLSPDVSSGGLAASASYFFVQKLPTTSKWKYTGKTVMLIDERTVSQAEHTGLFLESANKTEFIGTSSAGADGDVTNFVVPGGVTIAFSGHDVRHANGGALQRLGLQPAVSVAPTLAAIRNGHDQVLEKAIEYVSPGKVRGSALALAALSPTK